MSFEISYEWSSDVNLLKRLLLRYPRIWDALRDDFSPTAEEYSPPMKGVHYVLAIECGEPFGFFALFPESPVCWQLHLGMPLDRRAQEALRGLFGWLWPRTPRLSRIIAGVPGCNSVALRFARRAGMVEYGFNPVSFMREGKLWDQILLGVTRPQEGL